MARRRHGELKVLMIRELAKHQPEEWVKGPVLAADMPMCPGSLTAVARQLNTYVETKKGINGGYRLTARGRRHPEAMR